MVKTAGERSALFPAIEKKYGEKVTYWLALLKDFEGTKYPEQIAYLRENYGFSQAHANAVVMYFRGSSSSKRFDAPKDFFAQQDPKAAKTAKQIFKVIQEKYPKLELVIAWNQPMLRIEKEYVFGLSIAKNHITLAPWSTVVLEKFRPRLQDFVVNKKTFIVPLDWKVDTALLEAMARARLAELK